MSSTTFSIFGLNVEKLRVLDVKLMFNIMNIVKRFLFKHMKLNGRGEGNVREDQNFVCL